METKQIVSLFSLTAIQIGGAFCLPVIMAGQMLSQTYGFFNASLALLVGNILLWICSIFIGKLSTQYKQSTLDLARTLFGQKGAFIGALALLIPMIGWFSITLSFISQCFTNIIPSLPVILSNIIISVLLIVIISSGLKNVGILSSISIPLLLIAIAIALYKIIYFGFLQSTQTNSSVFSATATVIAIAIAAVVDLPTYYRFAASNKSAQISLAFVFLIGLPLVEGLGVLIGAFLPGKNLVEVFTNNHAGLFSNIMMLFLAFKGFATNSTNLYSAANSLKGLFPKLNLKNATIIAGVLGSFLSFFPLIENLEKVLSILAITTSSLGALFFTASVGLSFSTNMVLISSLSGITLGILTLFSSFTISGEPLCDSFFATMLIAFLSSFLKKKD